MALDRRATFRRGLTVRDLAVVFCCLLVGGGMLAGLAGANRDLSQAQVCANNLRMLFTGLCLYVEQYSSYPPHAPYPQYAPNEMVNGVTTGGWDPSMGWLLTYGLGLEPPAWFSNGQFKWYVATYEELPDVCKCPAMSPALLDLANPELDPSFALESVVFNYALSYQTSGTCRAACPVRTNQPAGGTGTGGRNPPIPDPTSEVISKPYDNSEYGNPFVWALQHKPGAAPDDPSDSGNERSCYIQAVHPAEVQAPSRLYYLADGRDYRPSSSSVYGYPAYPPAGKYNGYYTTNGNRVVMGSRHYGYANVMYLDGRVSRSNQWHFPTWNMDYDTATGQPRSSQWRASTFATDVWIANIRTQVHLMPVLMVKGWEYFFEANGLTAR
jgi:prepilin-type processing-associated H-X9-DG protein